MSFGEVIGRLKCAGIERYHADNSRRETAYDTPDGDSRVVLMEHGSMGAWKHDTGTVPVWAAQRFLIGVMSRRRGVRDHPSSGSAHTPVFALSFE